MRRARVAVAIVWMFLVLRGVASAQDELIGTISGKNNSVTKVMQQAGCNRGWLSQVVADSRIDPAKVRYLRAGQKLYLRGGSCRENPPEQIVNLSKMLLRMDLDSMEARRLRTELASLRDSANTFEKRAKGLTAENEKLQLRVTNLEVHLDEAKEAEREANARGEKGLLRAYAIPSGAGLVAGMALACYATIFWFRRMTLFFRKIVTVRSHGKSYGFELIDAVETVKGSRVVAARYKCPLCPAHDVFSKSLIPHIETVHPGERLKVDVSTGFTKASDVFKRVM